ncbi:MAG: response regulator [Myxococcota bacterium]|nr:response regulator [Myxococcota bacterium]
MSQSIDILLVEDNEGDAHLTCEALKRAKVRNRVHTTTDGVEAMQFLKREGPYADAPRPDLVILDLNLPNMDGREVLEAIKANGDLRSIPVVVVTSSEAETDIVRTYALNANAYVTKPLDLQQFLHVIGSIGDFWLDIVKLPPKDR